MQLMMKIEYYPVSNIVFSKYFHFHFLTKMNIDFCLLHSSQELGSSCHIFLFEYNFRKKCIFQNVWRWIIRDIIYVSLQNMCRQSIEIVYFIHSTSIKDARIQGVFIDIIMVKYVVLLQLPFSNVRKTWYDIFYIYFVSRPTYFILQ